MKRIFITLSLLSSLQCVCAQGLQNDNGGFLSLGAGFAPIYIEEIIDNDELSSGASAVSFNTNMRLGWVLKDYWALYAVADHNWYSDSQNQIYANGLLGLGVSYLVPDFYNSYLFGAAGLGNMTVFGADLRSSGRGFNLGYGLNLSRSFAVELSYNHLELDAVVSSYGSGDSEAINALNVRLSYNWH